MKTRKKKTVFFSIRVVRFTEIFQGPWSVALWPCNPYISIHHDTLQGGSPHKLNAHTAVHSCVPRAGWIRTPRIMLHRTRYIPGRASCTPVTRADAIVRNIDNSTEKIPIQVLIIVPSSDFVEYREMRKTKIPVFDFLENRKIP